MTIGNLHIWKAQGSVFFFSNADRTTGHIFGFWFFYNKLK